MNGTVYDAGSDQTLPGATVQLLRGTDRISGTITDFEGHYVLLVPAPGMYRLRTSYVGFQVRIDTVSVSNTAFEFDILLEPSRSLMDELVVETVFAAPDRFAAGLTTIRPDDLARVPMPDVSYDLAGYLQTRPGIVTTGDRGGQLFVRGGTPTQNLILLDGMPVFQPFHIVGFYSAFPADNVAYADVYAGGFPAKYGGRISSVIDIVTTNGDKSRVRASASIAPFLSGVRLELPVVEDKVSLVLSVRESVIDRIAKPVLGEELPFRFGDRFVKFHAFLNRTSTFSFTGLQTFDSGNLSGPDDETNRRSTWKNDAYGATYQYIPPESAVMTELSFYYSRIRSRYRLTPTELRRSDIDDFKMRVDFVYLMGDNEVRFGIYGGKNSFDFDVGSISRAVDGGVSSGGGFIQGKFKVGERLQVEPGLRMEAFSRGRDTSYGPRVRLAYLPQGEGSRHRFSAAWGMYHQQLVGLMNEQDVSDVFTIWAANPRTLPVPQATHYILGWKGRVTTWMELSAEGYYKALDHVAFPVFTDELNNVAEYSSVEGVARGVDTGIIIESRQMALDIGYSLAEVDYTRPVQFSRAFFFAGAGSLTRLPEISFNPPHDRRHQLNAMTRWVVGNTAFGVRWQFGSGMPFTRVEGYYSSVPVTDPSGSGHLTAEGKTYVSRTSPYDGRLPTYHRMDVTLEHKLRRERAEITFQGGLINVYNRANIFEYNIFSGERVDQLPLIPSVGLRVDLL